MLFALHSWRRASLANVTLYCAKLSVPPNSSKTWEVQSTKVEHPPFPGKWSRRSKGRIKSMACGIVSANHPGKGCEREALFGVPTKVDLHVCHVTRIALGNLPDAPSRTPAGSRSIRLKAQSAYGLSLFLRLLSFDSRVIPTSTDEFTSPRHAPHGILNSRFERCPLILWRVSL